MKATYSRRGADDVSISPEIVATWRRTKELRPVREACRESSEPCEHAECAEYHELTDRLFWALDLRPWTCGPGWCSSLWFQDGEPCSDEPTKGCHRAARLRDALNAALEATP